MCISGAMDKEFPPSRNKNPSNLASNIIRNNRVVQGALYGGENCKPVQIDIGWICCCCLQTFNCPRDSFTHRYKLNEIQLELHGCTFFDKEIVIFLQDGFSTKSAVIWKQGIRTGISIFLDMHSSRIGDKQRSREIAAQVMVAKRVLPMLSNPGPILSLMRISFNSPFA